MNTTWPRSNASLLKLWWCQNPNWPPKPWNAPSSCSDRVRMNGEVPGADRPFMAESSIAPVPVLAEAELEGAVVDGGGLVSQRHSAGHPAGENQGADGGLDLPGRRATVIPVVASHRFLRL